MAAPTEVEKKLLLEFREKLADLNLKDEQNSDMFLIRWIRARDHKLDQAEEMLRASLIWHKEHDLTDWKPPAAFKEELSKIWDVVGYDEDNSPVFIVAGGSFDFRKIIDAGQTEDFYKFKQSIYDTVMDSMRGKFTREGVPVTQGLFIVDLEGASVRQMTFGTLNMMKQDAINFESNYPEIMKTSYIINAPWFVSMVMNVMKTILPAKTVGKFNFFPSDPTKWGPALKEVVPLDVLPACYGGNNKSSKLNDAKETL